MALSHKKGLILKTIPIELSLEELMQRLPTASNSDTLLKTAEVSLTSVYGIWAPRAIIRWLPVAEVLKETLGLCLPNGKQINLATGFSTRFIKEAKQVLLGVYTVGDRLKSAAADASAGRRHLDAYVYDMISMAVLEKTGQYINKIIETRADEMKWGVSPVLSPGSVHGWEMTDQAVLCNLLPLDKIGVIAGDKGVLQPFDTVSCLVGIGPGYTARTVASTCEICSNKDNCEMKKSQENS